MTGRTVDAGPAAAHLRQLRHRTGATFGQLAARSGIRHETLQAICAGTRPRIYRSTETKILALDLPPQRVDATGTHRRIRALAAAAHSLTELSTEAGYSTDWMRYLLTCATVPADAAARVAEIYDCYHATEGTHTKTRCYAARHHWPGPDAWTDDTIDDPHAHPYKDRRRRSRDDLDWVVVWYLVRGEWDGPTTLAERAAAVNHLTGRTDPATGEPYSAERIAERIGLEERSVVRWKARLRATA